MRRSHRSHRSLARLPRLDAAPMLGPRALTAHAAALAATLAVACGAGGCLRVPPTGARGDGGAAQDALAAPLDVGPVDAGPPAPFAVRDFAVRDHTGRDWSAEAAPRWPILEVTLGGPPGAAQDDEGPPIWLLSGPADDDLYDDLSDDPLWVRTRERILGAEVTPRDLGWTVRPLAPLEPERTVTLAIGAWAREEAAERTLEEPWAAEVRISAAPEAGAQVTASWPADGAAAVAPSLPWVGVRFDGPVTGIREGVRLLESDAEAPGTARPVSCAELGWPEGWCASWTPERPLAAGSSYRVRVEPSVLDATGAPVGPWEGRFSTAREPDTAPPTLAPLPCAIDEAELALGCLFADDSSLELRVQASEPVRVRVAVAGQELMAVAPRGAATLVAEGLPPGTSFEATLTAEDAAGHRAAHPLTVQTTEPLATLSIVEVRADPRGPEPRQEYVEVLNFGDSPVDMRGVAISDRADAVGDVITQPLLLAPGQRALIVADGFDPLDPSDPPVPPGVPLVGIGRSLASGGLSNAGEPLFLRDAEGRRISAAPAIGPAAAGGCILRTSQAMRTGRQSSFGHHPDGTCTPGQAEEAPP